VQITQLTGDLGIATLSMPAPISVSQLANSPAVNGSIKLIGNLTDLTTLLSALQGEKPDAYPYRGDYTLSENFSTQASALKLTGGLQIAKFQSFNGNNVTFSEDLLSVGNDLSLTTLGADESVAITSLTAAMQSSGAMNLSMKNGSIGHLQTTRDMQLQLNVNYDLAKLWPIVQPMMGEQYKTVKISGQYQKQFNVTGSYPANQPSTVAIKTLHADGDVAVATFNYDGLDMKNFVVPFTLDNGKVVTVFVNKPPGQNTAAPAVANGGTVDLSNLSVDLTQDPPRLDIPPRKALISQLTINPLFTGTLLESVINSPLFAGAKNASGLLDLWADECVNFPLGTLAEEQTKANSGHINLRFSMTNLNIGLGNDAMQGLLRQNSFQANVNNGTVAIAKGISTQHIKFVTGDYTLAFDGDVRLKDQVMLPLVVGFPLRAIARVTHLVRDPNVVGFLPELLPIPLKGPVSSPSIPPDVFVKAIAQATVKSGAQNLLGGNGKSGGGGGGGNNPLGGLLKGLGK
jgi:hypothetical protein